MNTIKDIQDPSIRKLAETLKQSGLAASETEAIRMASNMSNTNSKVNKVFEDRKDKTIMGLSHLNKEVPSKQNSEPSAQNTAAPVEEPAEHSEQASNSQPADVPQNPESAPADFTDEDPSEQVIQQEMVEQPQEITASSEQSTEPSEPVHEEPAPIQEEVKVEEPEHSEQNTEHSEPAQEEVHEEPAPSTQQAEPSPQPADVPQTPERAPPQKNIAEMAESKVDLTKVFNFSA